MSRCAWRTLLDQQGFIMFKRTLLAAALACAFPLPALASSDAELAAEVAKIRAEFDQKAERNPVCL
jgi:hypothetical protein